MKRIIFILGLLAVSFVSCNKRSMRQEQKLHEQELALQAKELELKEKEFALAKQEFEQQMQQKGHVIVDLAQRYKQVKSSVYLIYAANSEQVLQGSAFVITSDGIAISNYHVFETADQAIAVNDENQYFQIAEILDYNEDKDYIIFRLNTIKPLPFLEITGELPEIGEDCFAVGNPKGLTQTLSKGIVSSYRSNNKWIQTSAEITHGSSGGPLFNKEGQVIGITTMGKGEANLNFALSISQIPYAHYKNQQRTVKATKSIDKERVKELISDYYHYTDNEMYYRLYDLYAPTLTRFFSAYNISRQEVIQKAEGYNMQFKVISTHSDVNWDTFAIYPLESGNYSVEYILGYRLVRENKSKPSDFTLRIIVEINPQYQIRGIYEKVIWKK